MIGDAYRENRSVPAAVGMMVVTAGFVTVTALIAVMAMMTPPIAAAPGCAQQQAQQNRNHQNLYTQFHPFHRRSFPARQFVTLDSVSTQWKLRDGSGLGYGV